MDGLDGDFLVRLKRESNKEYDRERLRRNMNDRKRLSSAYPTAIIRHSGGGNVEQTNGSV